MTYHQAKIYEYVVLQDSERLLTVGAVSRYMDVAHGVTPLETAIMIAHMMTLEWMKFDHRIPYLVIAVTENGKQAYKEWTSLPF